VCELVALWVKFINWHRELFLACSMLDVADNWLQ